MKLGVNINAKNNYGNTALIGASSNGRKDIVELIQNHINSKQQEEESKTDDKNQIVVRIPKGMSYKINEE